MIKIKEPTKAPAKPQPKAKRKKGAAKPKRVRPTGSGRPKIYATSAERQRAYRERRKAKG